MNSVAVVVRLRFRLHCSIAFLLKHSSIILRDFPLINIHLFFLFLTDKIIQTHCTSFYIRIDVRARKENHSEIHLIKIEMGNVWCASNVRCICGDFIFDIIYPDVIVKAIRSVCSHCCCCRNSLN